MSTRPFTLAECKIQATISLKLARSNDGNTLHQFKQLPFFAELDNTDIKKALKLKHALQIIANQYGFASWHNLKAYFEKTRLTVFPMHSGFLNHWFANYKEAKSYLHGHPQDFLLPYKNHFVVCDNNCLEHMGLNLQDKNWELIGHNWAEPDDYNAWELLNAQYSKQKKEVQNV